ncbi:uncharacterized protein EDB93DRAFT_1280164 [Suillus bovinus]|uniref:uncharacterized protein n=1 Tax=Suillus bovinus TaxID=48563 RepID=UPI001B85F8F7|nr:uncharacterized protein EDB93DRAFT_1280164 [Suillus bovinus]KAG2125648.1 hypothetical protein EDB93DRAFT_1280164 [Suillus bovinus]
MATVLSVSDMTKLQTVKYANLGSLAILVFDYCITFSEEVRWTWFKPWDVTRVIFFISRYLPFAGVGMTAYGERTQLQQSVCIYFGRKWYYRCGSPADYSNLGILAKEHKIADRFVDLWCVAAAIAVDLIPTMLIPGGEPPTGTCYFESTRNSAVVYTFLAMFESVMLILTVYKRVHDYNDFQSGILALQISLSNAFKEAITLANVIIGAALPSAYSNLFDTLQLVSHSVLASRILFHLRDSNERAIVRESSTVRTILDTVNYLQPLSMLMSGTGTTSEV